jgi:hypothetical protein
MSADVWVRAAVGPVSFQIPTDATSSTEHVSGQADVVRFFGGPGLVVAASLFLVDEVSAAAARRLTTSVLTEFEHSEGYQMRALGLVTVPGAVQADMASFVWSSPLGESVSSVCVGAVREDGTAAVVHACVPKSVDDDSNEWIKSVVSSIQIASARLTDPG